MANFTDKIRAFAAGKAAGLSGEQAAIQAGYAQSGAKSVACNLMKRDDIKKLIKQLKAGEQGPAGDEEKLLADKYADPIAFFDALMNNPKASVSMRFEAAKQLLPYRHSKMGEVGKKELEQETARKLSRGAKPKGEKANPFTRKQAPRRSHMVN